MALNTTYIMSSTTIDVDVFQCLGPPFVTMNFVQIEPGNVVSVRPVDEIHQAVCGKPQIVQRGIESLVDVAGGTHIADDGVANA